MKLFWNCALGVFLVICASLASAQGKKGGGGAAAGASSANAAAGQGPSSTGAFESQMLAYGGLDHIARAIAQNVCIPDINESSTILIYDQTTFATLQSYQAFIANAKVLVAAYNTLLPRHPASALVDWKSFFHELHSEYDLKAGGTSPAGELTPQQKLGRELSNHLKIDEFAALGLAPTEPFGAATSLLAAIAISSNTESAGSITIPDSAMAVRLVRELQKTNHCKGATIIYPPLFGHGSSSDFSSADIQVEIEKVNYIRKKAHEFIDKANADFIVAHPTAHATPAIPATPTTPAVPAKPATAGPNNTVLTSALTDIDGLYDSFINSLLQVNSGTGVIGSASVIQGHQLATLLAGQKAMEAISFDGEKIEATPEAPPAYVLLASIVASGGTQHVHKTFWTALTCGDKITYSGGAVVNVALWKNPSKSPIYADILRYRSPFRKIRDPADASGVESGDNLTTLHK